MAALYKDVNLINWDVWQRCATLFTALLCQPAVFFPFPNLLTFDLIYLLLSECSDVIRQAQDAAHNEHLNSNNKSHESPPT